MQGRLIVFEGTDGSGKATQTALLCRELDRRGVPYRRLEFPRYREESSALIRLYLSGAFGSHPGDVNAYAAATFYSVDRFASYRQDWGQFYESGGLLPTATPPPTLCTRPPSCPERSAGRFSSGCSILNTGCWSCQSRIGWCIWTCLRRFLRR